MDLRSGEIQPCDEIEIKNDRAKFSEEVIGTQHSSWKKISEIKITIGLTLKSKPASHWIFLFLSSTVMLVAFTASSLLSRAYYAGGGRSYWIISWAAVAGWPLIPLFSIPFYIFMENSLSPVTLKLLSWFVVLGFISFIDNLFFAWAYAYLSASTASLVASTSLVFSVLFGYFIAKNKMNLSSINASVIITASTIIIALDSKFDKIPGVTSTQYALAFLWDILGSALHGLLFALSELVFINILGRRSFHVVLELQTMISFFAFLFTTIGVIINNDFHGMRLEGEVFEYGKSSYYIIIVWTAVTFQLGVLAGTSVLYLASTILAGVLNATRVPLTSIVAVILFHDPMSGFKILSLFLTLWGFASYTLGHANGKSDP